MGHELYQRFPLFAAAFDDVNRALDRHLRLPLRQVMWGMDEALLESTEFAQPALFAVEVALASLLEHWGVVPQLVMGHSVGEIAAAYVADVLSLSDAATLVAARGRLMAALPTGGMMVAVAAAETDVAPLLADGVSIAAVNAPDAVVISGLGSAVSAVTEQLVRQGRRVRRLAVSHAFHSVLMEPMLGEFAAALAGISVSAPRIELVSNVTGELAGAGYGSASYWVDHVRMPVRFADSVRLAESLGASVFVEVGPHAGLTASQALLDRDGREVESLLTAVAQLFTAGVGVDWAAIFAGVQANRVELPTYGFVRQRFWLANAGPATADHVATEVGLWDRLAALDPDERHRDLLDLVRAHAAVVLGHAGGRDIDAERAFQDLGFGSMTGVELRNRLQTATGLPLPRTLIFDCPTAAELARYLGRQLFRSQHKESDDERIWSVLRNIPVQELRRTGLLDKLLLLAGQTETSLSRTTFGDDVIDSLSPEALIAMALNRDDGQAGVDENSTHQG
jgi:acyl transferase domain-containing protein